MQRAGSLLGKLKLAPGMDAEARAKAAWAVAAGKKIAGHTLATGLVRGTLVVEVGDMVWQRQLNSLRHFLVRNLAEVLGEALVIDIDFRPMRHPRTEAQLRKPPQAETARAGADGIKDPVMALLYQQSKRRA